MKRRRTNMSNVHEVRVEGFAPFDIATRAAAEPRVLALLANMNGPIFGLRIRFNPRPAAHEPNEFGGRTAFFAFEISGEEAVSAEGFVETCKAMRRLDVKFTRVDIRDIENRTAWRRAGVEVNGEKPLSMTEIEKRVSAYWNRNDGLNISFSRPEQSADFGYEDK
jgi:hypothetical protein